MRKFISFVIGITIALSSFAQSNLHIQQFVANVSNHESPTFQKTSTKLMYEGSHVSDNAVTYALFSGDFADNSVDNFYYMQVFQEFKFWNEPIFIHVEARTYNFYQNILYVGGAYTLGTKHGMIAIEPLVRNDSFGPWTGSWDWKRTGGQLSIVTGHDWGFVNLNTFTDIYNTPGTSKPNLYTEFWLYFPVTEHLQLGTITSFATEYSELGDFRLNNLNINLGLKVNF